MHNSSLFFAPGGRAPSIAPILCLVLLTACGSSDETQATDAGPPSGSDAAGGAPDGAGSAGGAHDAAPATDGATPVEPTCDTTHPPVVLAHGFLASGDTYSPHVRRFAANGECADRFYAFDWNTLDRAHDHAADLDALIDAVRAQHGVDRVDLVGHSAGGGLGYTYLSDATRAAKVRRYAHIASGEAAGPAGPEGGPAVPTLNLRSTSDRVVAGADIPGATNVTLESEDHYAVATSAASFQALYRFLRDDTAPQTDDPTGESGADGTVSVAGRVVVLGDNTPDTGSVVEIYALDPESGARREEQPAGVFTVGEDARFGPFPAATDTRYEFAVTSPREGARPVHYFYAPFQSDDALLYLRTLPTAGLPGALLGQIPFDDARSVVVVYLARGAMLAGRDHLLLDGEEIATEEVAAAEDTTIALFLYDDMNDGVDGGSTANFEAFPFLAGLDRALTADPDVTLRLSFNGVSLDIPRRPSGTEGASIVVFD